MNRKVLIQVTTPALVIGAILFGTCIASAWYISRLQSNMARILSENVTSLQAAQQLEIRARQLRFHCFLYLIDPTPARLESIDQDEARFREALAPAHRSADTPEEQQCVEAIEAKYQNYLAEMVSLRADVSRSKSRSEFGKLADEHPIRQVAELCQELFRLNIQTMDDTFRESERVTRQGKIALIVLGLLGPLGGLLIGYAVAQGLSRSIYQLSVRVHDVARCLDQNVASVSVAVNGDIQSLDRQLHYILGRVEEVGERLQKHQRELLRAEQLSAVGQLAASVAHEVRNPLTAVKMLVEAARRTKNTKPLTGEDLAVIHGEIARLEQTVQIFLDFARLPTPKRSSCDLRAVIGQAVELVQVRARQQKIQIAVDSPHLPVIVPVDRSQICTVLVNLFLNALDAMPHGGRLDVKLDFSPATGIRLVVTDTGTGIPPEIAGRLFTPFTSSKPTGTGLGLSLSRRIIEEHGGSLTAGDCGEKGACFIVSLPATKSGPLIGSNGTETVVSSVADSSPA